MDIAEFIAKFWLEVALTGVLGVLSWLARHLYKRNKAIELGVQALLRDRIIQAHRYHTKQRYCQVHERESLNQMYLQYHNLGGNGVATGLVQEVLELPATLPKEET